MKKISILLISVFLFVVAGCADDEPVEMEDTIDVPEVFGYIDTNVHLDKGYSFAENMSVVQANTGAEITIVSPPPFLESLGMYDSDTLMPYSSEDLFVSGGGGTLNAMIHSYGYLSEIPESIENEFRSAAKKIVESGAVGFGEVAALHLSMSKEHPFEQVLPNHPLWLLLSDLSAEYNFPILFHMEAVSDSVETPPNLLAASSKNPEVLEQNIPAFEELLDHNLDANIVWLQAGWDHTGDKTIELMKDLLEKHPNLYLGLKVGNDSYPETSPFDESGNLKSEWELFLTTFADRCVVATDNFFALDGSTTQPSNQRQKGIEAVLSSLPADVAYKIGYENAVKLFKVQ